MDTDRGLQKDDIIIAPEGIPTNLILRALLRLCDADSYSSPLLLEKVFVASSRTRGISTVRDTGKQNCG